MLLCGSKAEKWEAKGTS